jgi:hypothetical protein
MAAFRDGRPRRGPVPAAIAVEAGELRLKRAIAADAATDARYAAGRKKPGRGRRNGESAEVRQARGKLAAAVKARGDAERRAAERDGGTGNGKKRAKKPPEPVRNITDPDSRVMHCTLRGKVQACNAQARRTRDGLFLLPLVTQDPNDAFQVETALAGIAASRAVIAAGHAAGGRPSSWSRIGTLLFDNGFFSQANIELPGPDRLIGTGDWKDPGPHSPGCRHEEPRDQTHHNLATRQGADLYRHRAPVSEGGFADLKERTGLRQFALRGLAKAQGEFLLATLAGNIHLGWRRGVSLA